MAHRHKATRCKHQNENLNYHNGGVDPVLLSEEARKDPQVADDCHCRKKGDADEIYIVPHAEEGHPAPPIHDFGPMQKLMIDGF